MYKKLTAEPIRANFKLKLIIYIFFCFWTALIPANNFFASKYLSFVFLGSALFIFFSGSAPYFRKNYLIIAYFVFLIFLMIIHAGDLSSVINIGAMIFSIFSVAVLAWHTSIKLDYNEFANIIIRSAFFSFLMLFFISIVLTALKVSWAPDFYPWEAFFSEKRMLLVNESAGHTDQLWLLAWLGIFYVNSYKKNGMRKGVIVTVFVVFLITVFLLSTKTRLALLFIGVILFNLISFFIKTKNRTYGLILKLFLFSIAAFYIFSISLPEVSAELNKLFYQLQSNILFVRITPEEQDLAFSGRDFLNRALFYHWTHAPWFGLGNSHPIFLYGVNENLEVNFSSLKIVGSESGLNTAAKYGVFFLIITLALILSPFLYPVKSNIFEYRSAYSVGAMLFLTFVFNGGFVNYYNSNAVFLYLILFFYFRSCLENRSLNLAIRK